MIRQFSAGGAVFKNNLWLIIKPRPSPDFPADRYQLPKGLIEPGEKPVDTAIREVFEETGIMGEIIQKVSDSKFIYSFQGEKIFKVVTYYLMKYVSGEPTENAEVEKILWLPFDEAKKTLTYYSDKSVLEKALERSESFNPSSTAT